MFNVYLIQPSNNSENHNSWRSTNANSFFIFCYKEHEYHTMYCLILKLSQACFLNCCVRFDDIQSEWFSRWTSHLCVRAVVQTSPEVVKVRLVRQREAPEVSHTRGDCHRSLALLRHQGPQLLLWTAQCDHVRNQLLKRLVF